MKQFDTKTLCPQLLHHGKDNVEAFSHIEEQRKRSGQCIFREQLQLFHHVVDPVYAETDAHSGYAGNTKQTGEIVVTAATAYAADLYCYGRLGLIDHSCIIIEPSCQCN